MAENNYSAISGGFFVKTSDLVQIIQNENKNKDFYLGLLMKRMDKLFESPASSSMQQNLCGFPRKIPHSSIMDKDKTCIDDLAVKAILIVATVLESFAIISNNDCLKLLKEIYRLAKSFHLLKDFSILSNLHKIKNVEADPLFSTIFDALHRCFLRRKGKDHDRIVLNGFKYRRDIEKHLFLLKEAHEDLRTQMFVCILRSEQRRTQRKDEEDDVDRDEENRLKDDEEIRNLCLKFLKSKEHSMAVILGGQFATNVANATYENLKDKLFENGFKFAKVKVAENVEFNPNTEELQAQILQELEGKNKYRGKQTCRKLRKSIQKDPVFIYMDNILSAHDVRSIFRLESQLHPKKVRLLVTSPNRRLRSLLGECNFECKEHPEVTSEASKDPLLEEMVSAYLKRNNGADAKSRENLWESMVVKGDCVETAFRFALENSFLNLPATAQDAFLDIFCFFIGWDWDEISHIVGEEELQTLESNTWVKRNRNNQIAVPDRPLEWARQQRKGTRLTSNDELQSALSSEELIRKIKGILLLDKNQTPVEIPAEKLELMSDTLRVLSLRQCIYVKGKCKNAFPKMRFLQVAKCALPFHLYQLRNLSYFGYDEDGDFNTPEEQEYSIVEQLKDLRRSNISMKTLKLKCFQILGASKDQVFMSFDKLRKMSINLYRDTQLPESLSQLHFLQNLDLHDCQHLQILPNSFGDLRCLAKLNLGYCQSLKCLPETFGQLRSLEELILTYCSALKQLPASFVWLGNLKKATFSHCHNLRRIPANFSTLSSLEEVDFSFCKNLKLLSTNFKLLSSLKLLNIEGCSKLEKLPDSFPERLLKSEWVAIKLCGCSSLKELPEEFFHGNKIEYLSLADCTNLKRLPKQINQLKQLKKLNLSGCENLHELPKSFRELLCLEVLNLSSCKKLSDLRKGFHYLTALKDLNVSSCPRLRGKWMITFQRMQSLRLVDIRGSDNLHRWMKPKMPYGLLDRMRCLHFIVLTDQAAPTDQGMPRDSVQVILDKAASKFLKEKARLIDLDGKPFFPSKTFSQDVALAFIFDHNISRWDWEMLENNVDELIRNLIGMQIIYVGRSFSAIPTKLAKEVLAYTPENSKALKLFDKPLSATAGTDFWHFGTYIIRTTVSPGKRHFTNWESISGKLVGQNFKIEEHNNIMKEILAIEENDQQKLSLKLLEALTLTTKETNSAEGGKQVKIGDLKEKIFLLISTLEISKTQISFLKEMYKEMLEAQRKQRDYKIIWVWVPVVTGDEDTWRPTYKMLVQSMPWAVITNPWSREQSALATFFRETIGFCEMPLLVRLRPGVGIYPTDLMPVVSTLGSAAFLFFIDEAFSRSDIEEGDMVTKMEISNLGFLFLDFPDIVEAWSDSQMIWLYGGDHDMISEFNQKLQSLSKEAERVIQIVYVGRRRSMGDNGREQEKNLYKKETDGITWQQLSFSEAQRFWHRAHYLMCLVPCLRKIVRNNLNHVQNVTNDVEVYKAHNLNLRMGKIESLQRLLLGLLSLDCLSRRNGSVWMMAINGERNEMFTGRGKELVDFLSKKIDDSKLSICMGSGVMEVFSRKAQSHLEPQIEIISQEEKKTFEVDQEHMKMFEDEPWVTVHHPSRLKEHTSDLFCSLCYFEPPAYQCNTCECFYICQECYKSEFVVANKQEMGENIYTEDA